MANRKHRQGNPKVTGAKPEKPGKLRNGDVLEANGFSEAMIGVGHRCGEPPVAVYDAQHCLRILMTNGGFELEEAFEFFSDQVEAAWVGDRAPIWVYPSGTFDRGDFERGVSE